MSDRDERDEPALRIITADATDEEIAALVAVFAALGAAGDAVPATPRPEWNAPHRLVRVAHPHGPGGWRASGLPR